MYSKRIHFMRPVSFFYLKNTKYPLYLWLNNYKRLQQVATNFCNEVFNRELAMRRLINIKISLANRSLVIAPMFFPLIAIALMCAQIQAQTSYKFDFGVSTNAA